MNWSHDVWIRLVRRIPPFEMLVVWLALHWLGRQCATCTHTAARAQIGRQMTQYPVPSLGFIMYVVRWLFCDASVANHRHPPPNGFSMCLAAHWLQRSQILESWNEAGYCCAPAGGGYTLLWKENLTGRKLRNKVLRKGDKGYRGRNCVLVGECVCEGAASPLPAIIKTNGNVQNFLECPVALNFKVEAERNLGGMETLSKPITSHSFPPFMGNVMIDW